MQLSRYAIAVPEAFKTKTWKVLKDIVKLREDFLTEWALDTLDVEAQAYVGDTDYDDFVETINEEFTKVYSADPSDAMRLMIDESYQEMKTIRKVVYKVLRSDINYVEATEEHSVTVTLDESHPEEKMVIVNFIIN